MIFLLVSLCAFCSCAQTPNPISCPDIPSTITYATNTKLPDPFLSVSGSRITTKEQWVCRKKEIRQILQRYELGPMPPTPSLVTATFASNSLKITVSDGGEIVSFSVSIKFPTSGKAPYPATIAYGGGSIPIPSTVAIITYSNFDVGADNGRGKGTFYDLYGSNNSAGGFIADTWGVSRILDALEITPSANINPKRVGVTGCSRNGKGPMVAGAFDDRLALAIPREGGQGSAGCWRIADEIQKQGTKVETAHQIVNGDTWYSTEFSKYVDSIPSVPFDNHMMHALYAYPPRGLLFSENSGIAYLGPWSNYQCVNAGKKAFKALGIDDYIGFSQVNHSDHCGFPAASKPDLTAFINRFLLDQETNIRRL